MQVPQQPLVLLVQHEGAEVALFVEVGPQELSQQVFEEKQVLSVVPVPERYVPVLLWEEFVGDVRPEQQQVRPEQQERKLALEQQGQLPQLVLFVESVDPFVSQAWLVVLFVSGSLMPFGWLVGRSVLQQWNPLVLAWLVGGFLVRLPSQQGNREVGPLHVDPEERCLGSLLGRSQQLGELWLVVWLLADLD